VHAVPILVAACGGFLLAVLWMDLMFDVQVLRHRRRDTELPEAVLASIAAYYRRVTSDARPLTFLVAGVMAVLVLALALELANGEAARWLTALSLVLAGGPIGLALGRTLPNAIRLGARTDPRALQSDLARSICRDHLLCLAGVLGFLVIQIGGAAWRG